MTDSTQRIKYAFLKIITGSSLSRRRIPFMSAESAKPGPVLWLTGCVHGDEVGGMVIIQEIFKKIRKTPLSSGTLCAFPLMNPIGFESASRNITMSKEDLNRSFPGNSSGSLAERMAAIIFSAIVKTGPSLVLDLHNDWMKSIPYTLIDPNPGTTGLQAHDRTMEISKKTGFITVRDTEEIRSALSYNLIQQGIPALTIELGESLVVNEKNVEYGVKSILNILSFLKMIEPPGQDFSHPLSARFRGEVLEFSDKPVSSTSGVIRFLARPGDLVMKGQPVARIYNSFGKLQETISSPGEAVVLGHSDSSVAFPGAPVMSFANLTGRP
ncbi:MAG: succinylglutamate desuccinylase/aspartoacylase family protein [Candidatus Glassbacteria bacterium]|nr:succinylglutamate desuccinylase/aspartoacylase family protein [Candidatus Glassbacteria bacterium]